MIDRREDRANDLAVVRDEPVEALREATEERGAQDPDLYIYIYIYIYTHILYIYI